MRRYLLPFILPLGIFLSLVMLLGAALHQDPHEIPSPLIGKPAPAFTLAQLDHPDRSFGPQDMKGRVWVLNVWASWCAACRQEHPLLLELARRDAAPIVGLDYMDAPAEGIKWLARHGNPYQLSVLDPKGKVGMDYGVYGVPETYVIDKLGIVRLKHTGPVTTEVIEKKLLPRIRELKRG